MAKPVMTWTNQRVVSSWRMRSHVSPVVAVLTPVDRELAQRQPGMQDEHGEDEGDEGRNQPRVRLAEQRLALEQARHPPHGIVAEQDRRHEEHVQPHEQAEKQTGQSFGPRRNGRPRVSVLGWASRITVSEYTYITPDNPALSPGNPRQKKTRHVRPQIT